MLRPCKSFSLCTPYLPLTTSIIYNHATQHIPFTTYTTCLLAKTQIYNFKIQSISSNSSTLKHTHVTFCTKNEVFEEVRDTHVTKMAENDELEELELLNKPVSNGSLEIEPEKPNEDEVLEPFYKFFRTNDSLQEDNHIESIKDETGKVDVEYYEPKPGDYVVGVVVSGNENKLDINIGADLLATMLTKEVLPLYDRERDYLLCDVEKDAEDFMVKGKMGIVWNEENVNGENEVRPGKPIVEPGIVLFGEILGRTLSGRPLMSTRRLFRCMAWHRLRQIKQLNEPILVKITEWNTGGLLTRIEGLRAFLPKAELMNRVNNFTDLKENVGRQVYVLITRINEETNDLILSEKEAWEMLNLQTGTLLEGTVRKIYPYGAQIRIGESNRSGLLHISKITQGRVTSVSDLLAIDEKVKVVVVKSMFPDKIALSIADLESEPGLFLSDKERVFCEAEMMAKKYRQRMAKISGNRKFETISTNGLPFEDEENLYANWRWFKFE